MPRTASSKTDDYVSNSVRTFTHPERIGHVSRSGRNVRGTIGVTTRSTGRLFIAVAATHEERLRVARLLGQDVAVMMVASREEAVALLLGNDPPPTAPGRRAGGVPAPGDDHRPDRRLGPAHGQLPGRVRPAVAAGARPAALSGARARDGPGRSRSCTGRSGAPGTSAGWPTCSRWSSGCAASCVTCGARSGSARCVGSGCDWTGGCAVHRLASLRG